MLAHPQPLGRRKTSRRYRTPPFQIDELKGSPKAGLFFLRLHVRAALLARGWGKPCIVGARDIAIACSSRDWPQLKRRWAQSNQFRTRRRYAESIPTSSEVGK